MLPIGSLLVLKNHRNRQQALWGLVIAKEAGVTIIEWFGNWAGTKGAREYRSDRKPFAEVLATYDLYLS